MGIFSKLKNTLTGGWAKVSLECPGGTAGSDIPVTVRVAVGDNPIQIEGVYLKIQSQECVDIPGYAIDASDPDQNEERQVLVDILETDTVYTNDMNLAGATELQANQEYTFEGAFPIPQDSPPTYKGRKARHVWEIKAGLDMKGNDPDSGWVEINIA